MNLSKVESLPTEMKVGDRIYEIFCFLKKNEEKINSYEMTRRAKEMNAHLGEDDAQYLLDHRQDIPIILRDKVTFVFTDWNRYPDDLSEVYFVYYAGNCWVGNWYHLGGGPLFGEGFFLRPK